MMKSVFPAILAAIFAVAATHVASAQTMEGLGTLPNAAYHPLLVGQFDVEDRAKHMMA